MKLIERLEQLPECKVPCHSATFSKGLATDAPLLKEVVRITQSASINMQYASREWTAQALAPQPKWLAVHLSPFHHKWNSWHWTGDDWRRASHAPIPDYFEWLQRTLSHLRSMIGNQKTIFLLDHERWPGNEPVVEGLLNAVVTFIKREFPDAKIAWYNWGRKDDPNPWHVSTNVYSDYAGESLYFQPGSRKNFERFSDMWVISKATDKLIMPCVSLGRCYEERDYTPHGTGKRSRNVIAPVQLGQTWSQGKWLVFGERVDAVWFWPKLFKNRIPDMPEHFIAWMHGAAGLEYVPGGA